MKKINIFIASSAELQEDKQMFDLYFSEKNKLLRPQNIDLDQRTWMDFSSSLNTERLQDRYNEYIGKCDIVVFLFHTRLGRYTKEELEVAYEAFIKNKGKNPRIFIYFKEEGIEDEALKDFKRYCESNLGHFCDIYSDHQDLRIKFDKQLQLLMNEGYIKGDPVDLRRTARFFLLAVCLPLILAALTFLCFWYLTPATCTLTLTDTTPSQLTFKGAELSLEYSDVQENTTFQTVTEEKVFKDIHRKHMGKDARVMVTSSGFIPVDTLLKLDKKIVIPIKRDESKGIVFGMVKDEDNRPVKGVTVSAAGISAETDVAGQFRIVIPLDKQREEQRVTAYKEGYKLWDFSGPTSDKVPWKIILRK